MEFQTGAVSPTGSISEGWNLIKNEYWLFFAMTLVFALVVIVIAVVMNFAVAAIAGIVSVALGIAMPTNAGDIGKISASIVPQLISQFLGIFTGLISGTLSALFICGIYTALARKANGETPDFGDLFQGFKYFQQCLIVTLIFTLIRFALGIIGLFIGAALGFSAFGAGLMTRDGKVNPEAISAIFGGALIIALLVAIISIIIAALTLFVYPLIAERKLGALEAISTSIKAGFGNFLGIIGLIFLLGFMLFGGLLLCAVGAFFVLPILYAAIFTAYRHVFGTATQFGQRMPPPPPSFN